MNTRDVRQIVKVARDKPEKFREIIMKCCDNNSYISVGDLYGNISSNISVNNNNKNNNTKCDMLKFSKSMNLVYKKCIMALRISLKSIDIQLEELENNHYHYGNDDNGRDPYYR